MFGILHQSAVKLSTVWFAVNPTVIRNRDISWPELRQLVSSGRFDSVVISPGPGSPDRPADVGAYCTTTVVRLSVLVQAQTTSGTCMVKLTLCVGVQAYVITCLLQSLTSPFWESASACSAWHTPVVAAWSGLLSLYTGASVAFGTMGILSLMAFPLVGCIAPRLIQTYT